MKNRMRFKKRQGAHKGQSSGRIREQAQKMSDHYSHLAREATSSDDRVMAEYYWQHVDHYKRVLQEFQPPAPMVIGSDDAELTTGHIIEIEDLNFKNPPDSGIVEIDLESELDSEVSMRKN